MKGSRPDRPHPHAPRRTSCEPVDDWIAVVKTHEPLTVSDWQAVSDFASDLADRRRADRQDGWIARPDGAWLAPHQPGMTGEPGGINWITCLLLTAVVFTAAGVWLAVINLTVK